MQGKYYALASQANALITTTINKKEQAGKLTQNVWGKQSVFLDYLAGASKDVWAAGLQDLKTAINYDGLWLDANEATGSCNGECPPVNSENGKRVDLNETLQNLGWFTSYTTQNEISTYKMPFIPNTKWNLDNQTMSLNATHPSGD